MKPHSSRMFPGLLRMYGPSTRITPNTQLEAEVAFRNAWYDLGMFFGTSVPDVEATAWSMLYNDAVKERKVATLAVGASRRLYNKAGSDFMEVRDVDVLRIDADNIKRQYMGILQAVHTKVLPEVSGPDNMIIRVRNDYFMVVPYDAPRWDLR